MAIVQDDVYDYLKSQDDSYEGMKAVKMRKIMPLYYEYVLVMANRSSGIDTIEDFAGMNICLCEKTSGSFISGINIINSYGFDTTNAPTYYFKSPQEGVAGVVAGTYDAVIFVDSWPTTYLDGLSSADAAEVKLISAAVNADNTYYNYSTVIIPQSDFPDIMPDGDITGNARVMALLVMSGDVGDSAVPDFIDTIYSQNESGMLTTAPNWDTVSPDSGKAYFRYSPYGWSRAAAQYYSEKLSE